VDEPEQELALLSKSIIDSVFYVTAPPRKISASLLPQLGGDPLHRPLSVLGGYVRVDALVAKVRDDRPQEGLWLLHVVERW